MTTPLPAMTTIPFQSFPSQQQTFTILHKHFQQLNTHSNRQLIMKNGLVLLFLASIATSASASNASLLDKFAQKKTAEGVVNQGQQETVQQPISSTEKSNASGVGYHQPLLQHLGSVQQQPSTQVHSTPRALLWEVLLDRLWRVMQLEDCHKCQLRLLLLLVRYSANRGKKGDCEESGKEG